MPHLTLEHSANVIPQGDLQTLFARLHRILAEVGGIKIENCKSRARSCETYLVASGEPSGAFVHLDVRFLEGRRPEVKRAVGDRMLESLRWCFPEPGPDGELQVTVELRDIARESYFKYPKGTLTPQA